MLIFYNCSIWKCAPLLWSPSVYQSFSVATWWWRRKCVCACVSIDLSHRHCRLETAHLDISNVTHKIVLPIKVKKKKKSLMQPKNLNTVPYLSVNRSPESLAVLRLLYQSTYGRSASYCTVRWNRSEVCGETGTMLLYRDAASLKDLGKSSRAATCRVKATVDILAYSPRWRKWQGAERSQ